MIPDLMLIIFRFLKDVDLACASRVCRAWYKIAQDEKLWADLYRLVYGTKETRISRDRYLQAVVIAKEEARLQKLVDAQQTLPFPAYKLVIVGSGTVEKAHLLISFANGRYPEDYVPSNFDKCATDQSYQTSVPSPPLSSSL